MPVQYPLQPYIRIDRLLQNRLSAADNGAGQGISAFAREALRAELGRVPDRALVVRGDRA